MWLHLLCKCGECECLIFHSSIGHSSLFNHQNVNNFNKQIKKESIITIKIWPTMIYNDHCLSIQNSYSNLKRQGLLVLLSLICFSRLIRYRWIAIWSRVRVVFIFFTHFNLLWSFNLWSITECGYPRYLFCFCCLVDVKSIYDQR